MQVDPRTPTTKNPPEQFTGDVWLDPVAAPRDAGRRMIVAKVSFAPGARTAWHSHALGQTLHVTQGIGADGHLAQEAGVLLNLRIELATIVDPTIELARSVTDRYGPLGQRGCNTDDAHHAAWLAVT